MMNPSVHPSTFFTFAGPRLIHQSAVFPICALLLFPLFLLLCSPMTGIRAAAIGGAGGHHCPQWVNDEIQQCVGPVAEFAKRLNRQQEEGEGEQMGNDSMASGSRSRSVPSSAEFGQALQWPTKMGGQVFSDLCRLIGDFEHCVEGYRDKCRRHITINLIEASYGFLCNEGFATFMGSAECLMELDQRPSVKRCHDRTLRDIEQANRGGEEGGMVQPKLDKMCSALNFFSDCVRAPIRQSCGRRAWRVIFRVLTDTTRTLMPMCRFEGEKEEDEGEEGSKTERRDEKMKTTTKKKNDDGWMGGMGRG